MKPKHRSALAATRKRPRDPRAAGAPVPEEKPQPHLVFLPGESSATPRARSSLMGRRGTSATAPERAEIDREVAAGEAYRYVSKKFGIPTSATRHDRLPRGRPGRPAHRLGPRGPDGPRPAFSEGSWSGSTPCSRVCPMTEAGAILLGRRGCQRAVWPSPDRRRQGHHGRGPPRASGALPQPQGWRRDPRQGGCEPAASTEGPARRPAPDRHPAGPPAPTARDTARTRKPCRHGPCAPPHISRFDYDCCPIAVSGAVFRDRGRGARRWPCRRHRPTAL